VVQESAVPSLVDRPFGIDQDAIEVEEHGGEAHAAGMAWKRLPGKDEWWRESVLLVI
jgi:hypothetical protein